MGYESFYDRAPISGYTFCRAGTTSSVPYEIPAAWKGCDVIFKAYNADFYINFGTSASVAAAVNQVSTLATATLTAHANTSAPVLAGDSLKIHIPLKNDADTAISHFAVISDTALGYWTAWRVSEV